MALSASDANVRDQVALRLTDRAHSALTTEQTTVISGTSGAIERALTQIRRWSQFFSGQGSDLASTPDDWLPWLVDLASYEGSMTLRPDLSAAYRTKALESQRIAFASYSRAEIDSASGTDELGFTLSSLRLYIASRCVKRGDPVYPDISSVDSAIDYTIKRVWNDAEWRFAQRMAVLTIATNQTVTVEDEAGNPLALDRIVGTQIHLEDGLGPVDSVDRDVLLRHRSGQQPNTGQPWCFHLEKSAGDVTFQFIPKPDQIYTARAMIQIKTPSITNPSTFDSTMALFPPEFVNIIRDMAYAKVLYDIGVADGARLISAAAQDLGGLVDEYDTPGGKPERSAEGIWRTRGLGIGGSYLGGGV